MIDLIRKAEDAGITIEYCRIPLNQSISVQDAGGDFVLMDYSLMGAGPKERVHLGHEIGHSMMGAFYNPYAPLDIRQKHENAADKWAIKEFVQPEALADAIKCGYTEIWQLADYFDVTEDFMRKVVCLYTYGNLAVDLYL